MALATVSTPIDLPPRMMGTAAKATSPTWSYSACQSKGMAPALPPPEAPPTDEWKSPSCGDRAMCDVVTAIVRGQEPLDALGARR